VLDGYPVGDPAPTAAPPHFRPMPTVAKRSPISATAELLLRYASGETERDIQTDRQTYRHVQYNTLFTKTLLAKCSTPTAVAFKAYMYKTTGTPQQNY